MLVSNPAYDDVSKSRKYLAGALDIVTVWFTIVEISRFLPQRSSGEGFNWVSIGLLLLFGFAFVYLSSGVNTGLTVWRKILGIPPRFVEKSE